MLAALSPLPPPLRRPLFPGARRLRSAPPLSAAPRCGPASAPLALGPRRRGEEAPLHKRRPGDEPREPPLPPPPGSPGRVRSGARRCPRGAGPPPMAMAPLPMMPLPFAPPPRSKSETEKNKGRRALFSVAQYGD